jgi:hypothetical protein
VSTRVRKADQSADLKTKKPAAKAAKKPVSKAPATGRVTRSKKPQPGTPAATEAPPQLVAAQPLSEPAPHFDDLAWGECPADLPVPEGGERPGLGWMTQVIVISTLLLLLFNSFAVDKWARSLPVTEQSGQIVDAADRWHSLMGRLYLNWPLETGRTAWHWLKDLQWPDQAQAGDADQSAPTQSADE